jgi:VWFA-related protein
MAEADDRRDVMRAIAVLILALLVPSHAAWAQSEERTIYATVVDKQDAPVTGLTTGAFIVRENDIAREVLRVSPATAPMQIALLVDTSQAIDNFIIDFRTGVQKFIKRMAGKNEIMLMGFGERPTQLVDFTRDGARLEKAMGSVFARQGSGTYLLEAIIDASRALRRHKAARPHIVVVAARGPEFSEHHHTNVVDAVREAGATLHTLMLERRSGAAAVNNREEQELQLTVDDGTRLSGGRRDDILTTMAIGDRMETLASELENQYQITYARPKTLIPPKTVAVSAKSAEVTVRAKQWP